jgi:hypothetical protein
VRLLTTTALAILLSVTTADAASFTCGKAMCSLVGFSQAECKKRSLTLALKWAGLPKTSAQPGAIVVQTRKGRALGGGPGGHVSKIVAMNGPCKATVIDNRGKPYVRDICSRLVAYVMPQRAWTE